MQNNKELPKQTTSNYVGLEKSLNALERAVDNLQEKIDELRFFVKYLVFDLEATRRESKYLLELLMRENEEDDEDLSDLSMA